MAPDPTADVLEARRRAVLVDVGAGADDLDVAGWLRELERAARAGERLSDHERRRLALHGSRAAEAGTPLPVVVDAWLTSGWVIWQDVERGAGPRDVGRLAGSLLRALDDGAQALAEGYVRAQRDAVQRDDDARAALLDGLLGRAPAGAVVEAATRLGVDVTGTRAVLVVGEVSETLLDRLRSAGALAAPRGGIVVAVLTGSPPRGPETAGLGRPGVGVAGIRRSFGEAQRALAVAQRLGLKGVVPYEQVLPEAVIGQDVEALRELVETTLGGLVGGRHGAEPLLATLDTYSATGLSVAETARRLDIHERTVRYRLQRVRELTGLDLADPDDRFRLDLALRGRRLLDAPERDG